VYHYAGNNPLKYTDPDGKTPENSTKISQLESEGGGNGYTMPRTENTSVNTGLANQITPEILEEGISIASGIATIAANIANDVAPNLPISKNLGEISTTAGILATVPNITRTTGVVLDVMDGKADPIDLIDPVSDLMISGSSFIPVLGPLVSAEADLMKSAVVNTAEAGAKIDRVLKKNPMSILDAVFNFFVRNSYGD
jgi:hypothetical protein